MPHLLCQLHQQKRFRRPAMPRHQRNRRTVCGATGNDIQRPVQYADRRDDGTKSVTLSCDRVCMGASNQSLPP